MYMLRYKFREAADLQCPTPPKCGPARVYMCVCVHTDVRTYVHSVHGTVDMVHMYVHMYIQHIRASMLWYTF